MNHRLFGDYIRNYQEKKAIPFKVKVSALTVLWATILISAFFFAPFLWFKVLLIVIASGASAHILGLKTLKE